MKFKESILQEQFWQLNPKLRMILCNLDFMCIKWFKKEIILTSLIRPKTTDSGIHKAKRGADARTIGYFDRQEIETIVEYINLQYPYDPKRPKMKSAIFHDVGLGEHIHIQVYV